MKTELEYMKLALAEWCRKHKWQAEEPLSGVEILQVLTVADELRATDRKALEASAS